MTPLNSMDEKKEGVAVDEGADNSLATNNGPVETGESIEVAVVKDGVPVHPQPTGDPLDPLNWATWQKHVILGIVMWM